MEPLHRRSDGIVETPSGLFAIVPKYSSGKDGENSWFEFKTDVFSDAIRVVWPTQSPFILLSQDVATAMLRLGYAGGIDDDLLARYEVARDEWLATPEGAGWLAAQGSNVLTEPPVAAEPPAVIEPPPAAEPPPPPPAAEAPEWTPPAASEPVPVATKAGSGDNAPSGGKGRRG